ncbi:metallophosphoesterase family protein [Pseudactinotalea sp.]|uniref:metallophosphoesterase family protein n=1 Tax=Pseudactinotalea sp. TaxID=1926260 RepID=UPI003B3AF2B5
MTENDEAGRQPAPEQPDATETPAPAAPRRRWEWWHQRSTAFRRAVRTSAVVLVAGIASLVFGVTTAQFTGSVGPHAAQYSTTLNSEITVDMGPLGALIIDSPLPLGLGADVVVKEIPIELDAGAANPIAGLTGDLSSYSQFLANPEAAIRDAANGVVRDAVGRTILAWSILLAVVALGRLASHGVLRQAARSALRQQGVPAMAIALTLALLVPVVVTATRGSGGVGRTSEVLAGTPLADARITGRLGGLIDFYGGYVVDAIRENDEFYAEVEANLRTAYATDPAPLEPVGEPQMVPTIDPASVETEDPADGSENTSDEPTSEPTEEGTEADGDATQSGEDAEPVEPDPVTLAVVTDLHCNVGMASVVGAAVELSEADVVLNAGDTVMGGTSVESVCVNAFADGIPAGVPVVVADGNHDSETTAGQEEARGWIVLRGETVEVAGLRILGDRDPMLTSLGAPTHPQRDETFEAMGERLNEVACEAAEAGDPIDILLVHNMRAAQAGLDSGCVGFTLNGHLHRRIGPWQAGLGIQYLSASTAGATKDTPTIGPLQNTATMTIIRWDRANGVPMDFRLITFGVDRSVTVEPWQSFPPRSETVVHLPVPAPGEGPWDAPVVGPGTDGSGDTDDADASDDAGDATDDEG